MKTLLLFTLFSLLSTGVQAQVSLFPDVPTERKEQITTLWGTKSSSPNLSRLDYAKQIVLHGSFLQRYYNTRDLVLNWDDFKKLDPENQILELSQTQIHFFNALNGLVMDASALTKAITYNKHRSSRRIEICTANLGQAFREKITPWQYFTPALHIALWIDNGGMETNDPQATSPLRRIEQNSHIVCQPMPLKSQEPESVVIERISCAQKIYYHKFQYQFFTNNCGSYTQDILSITGNDNPLYTNFGLGYFKNKYLRDEEKIAKDIRNTKQICDQHIDHFRKVLNQVEENRVPTYQLYATLGPEAMLQLLASSAQQTNRHVWQWFLITFENNPWPTDYFYRDQKVRRSLRESLKIIFKNFNSLGESRLRDEYTKAYLLYKKVQKLNSLSVKDQSQNHWTSDQGSLPEHLPPHEIPKVFVFADAELLAFYTKSPSLEKPAIKLALQSESVQRE